MRCTSLMPPAMAVSGWQTSTARAAIISAKAKRVCSLSPAAMGMSVDARTSAWPATLSGDTGSSSHARSQSATLRAKRCASRTLHVPCASTISPTSGPIACRASRTRAAESSTLLS